MTTEIWKESPMMANLVGALEAGEDIGHYGRLVFVMVGRFFISEEELIELLMKGRDCPEEKARAIVQQVAAKGYNPPKRERILEWMNEQDFPICRNADDPGACNVYSEVDFPPEVYEKISSYYESRKQ